ncbi:class I SAM-dependent methyltransferase [Pleomorphomonas sp. JP5]|uniref:class I SAM-dependent DNA methyltransferase n=1 Tax=Pleomorphomonas sp. JP5 TaxID=2942998 RepID=UPI00204485F6|nr:methyltransferase domain-containing protein [Pleomorphomonas sp. JP5]MCM5558182.1 methyltransferase domain-containing protein [Pleomorphomonas sp. JP5]
MHVSSSGDLLADRRYEYARAYLEADDAAAAADLFLQTLERSPGWLPALIGAADALAANGRRDEAEPLLREAAKRDHDGLFGASLRLAALGFAEVPDAPPAAYVRGLFDDYADRFETALVEDLGYRAPWLIADLIDKARPGGRFSRGLDLGCGTGLMAEALMGRVDHFTGCDLSPEMIARADAERRYQALAVADVVAYLRRCEGSFDLVTAADVLVYVGALGDLFGEISAHLASGCLFAFSVEESTGDDLVLRDSLRYAHSEAYIRSVSAEAGLAVLDLRRATLRYDRGAPIEGLVVLTAAV